MTDDAMRGTSALGVWTDEVQLQPDPCTPSTEHVRAVYAAQHGAILADEHGREFDRWLAKHDDQVLAGVRFVLDVHDRYVDASQGRSPDGFATRTATTLREVRKAVT